MVVQGRSRGRPELLSVSVVILNAGRVEASGIQAVAKVPGGGRIVLRGPRALPPAARAVYYTSSRAIVSGRGSVEVEALCASCR